MEPELSDAEWIKRVKKIMVLVEKQRLKKNARARAKYKLRKKAKR